MKQKLSAVLIVGLGSTSLGQGQAEQTPVKRIEVLVQQLRDSPSRSDGVKSSRDVLTAQVHAEIDSLVASHASTIVQANAIEAQIRGALSVQPYNREYNSPPFSRASTLRAGPSVLAGYTLTRDGHETTMSLRGYRMVSGRLTLTATTGADFDGYGFFITELASPVSGEMWVLVWGQHLTFNGSRVRLRIYSYDGEQFQTRWAPEDLLDAHIRVTPDGFSVDHLDVERYYSIRRPPYILQDDYRLTPNGPQLTVSRFPAQP